MIHSVNGGKVAIAANFTADPVTPILEFWLRRLEIPLVVELTPFDQIMQQLHEPNSLFGTNARGIDVVLLRLESWQGAATCAGSGAFQSIEDSLLRNVEDFLTALEAAASRSPLPHLLVLCRPSPDILESDRLADLHRRCEAVIASRLKGVPAVYVVTSTEVDRLYAVADYHEPFGSQLGSLPYTRRYYAALGTTIARKVHALLNPPRKVIAVDCDETLWGGVCGEVGPSGIALDAAHQAVQEFLIAQYDAGSLLCLCSKNNESDVLEVFENRPEMRIRLDHFAALRVNWRPKSTNLTSLADELQLGLQSFALVDDSPLECAEVAASVPEVLTVQLPEESEHRQRFLSNHWSFDRLHVTDVDRKRTGLYQENRARERFRQSYPSLRDFIDGLQLRVEIAPATNDQISRVAQLTERTNQFNLTTRRYSEAEIRAVCQSETQECLAVHVSDRFGDYGLVGALIVEARDDRLDVDTFLLSCRALGRGVEYEMLAKLGQIAESRGLSCVQMPYRATPRNLPVLEFLQRVTSDSSLFVIPAAEAASARYQPEVLPTVASSASNGDVSTAMHAATSDLTWNPTDSARMRHVALELCDAETILAAVDGERGPNRSELSSAYVEPRYPEEFRLVEIWREVLGIDRVGVVDNFFELGGHSLALTQVMARVYSIFGTQLSYRRFFEAPTVAEMAIAIRDEGAFPAARGFEDLLEFVSGMTEEEAERLLRDGDPVFPAPVRGMEAIAFPKTDAISSVVVHTCDRPEALRRALSSYLDNFRKYGRAPDLIVMDDSRSPAVRRANQEVLREFHSVSSSSLLYAGREEKTCFAKQLVQKGELPEEVLHFGLFGIETGGMTRGANSNGMLLNAVGELVFGVDDDTVCRLAASPDLVDGVAFASDRDPASFRVFPNREECLDAAPEMERDLLSLHEELLGKELAKIFGGHDVHRDQAVAGPAFQRRVAANRGRIVITSTGLQGDCGWGAPFGFWNAPMGHLLYEPQSHDRLVRSEENYRAAVVSRDILRTVDRLTISDMTFSMSTFLGLDNRELLPPCMPMQRGSDLLFGAVTWACIENGLFGHLPWTLLHCPVERRQFSHGEVFRTATGIDFARLMLECVQSFTYPEEVGDSETRMRGLGDYLVELATRTPGDFEAFVSDRLASSNARFLNQIENRLTGQQCAPKYWADDVQKYATLLRQAQVNRDYPIPLDLVPGRSVDAARQLTRDLVRRFGELLHWWPQIVATAKTLRAQGHRLGVEL